MSKFHVLKGNFENFAITPKNRKIPIIALPTYANFS